MKRKLHELKKLESLSTLERDLVLKFEEKYQNISVPEGDPGFILDIHTFARFLRARNFDFDASVDYFEKWMKWRLETKPHLITTDEIPRELACEKAYWHGFDKGTLIPSSFYRWISICCCQDIQS